MTLPDLTRFVSLALLLMRLLVGTIFISSGWSHVSKAQERAKSIEMSTGFTRFLGAAEIAGGLGVVFGVVTQLAAIGLILVMLGAIYKKMVVWHTGFWGEKSSGWHYDLVLVVMNLVIITTAGGDFVLMK